MNKKDQLVLSLRQMIAEHLEHHDFRFPTEGFLCRKFSVSRVTVRNALDELEKEGLLERRQGSGTTLTGKYPEASRNRIALLLADPSRYRSPLILSGVRAVAASHGFSLAVYDLHASPFREREILSGFLTDPPCGMILEAFGAGEDPNADLLLRLTGTEFRLPTVFLHKSPLGPDSLSLHPAAPVHSEIPVVREDSMQGARLLARTLLLSGHHHPAVVFPSCTEPDSQRFRCFLRACFECGLSIPDHAFFLPGNLETEEILDGKSAALSAFLHRIFGTCTVIVCSDDLLAAAILRTLSREGWNVPQDISLVCFEGSYLQQLPQFGTACLCCRSHPGKEAAKLLFQEMRGQSVQSLALPLSLEPGRSLRQL